MSHALSIPLNAPSLPVATKIDLSRALKAIPYRNVNGWVLFLAMVYAVGVFKLITLDSLDNNIFFAAYSVAIAGHILSRFILAYFYEPRFAMFDALYQPTLSFGVPAKNEGAHIRETILRIAQSKYPKDKFDIIAVNDGSTDHTLKEMREAQKQAAKRGVRVTVVDWKENRGKRDGMAECVRRSPHDLVVFIDSDSFVEPDTAQELAKYFSDPRVGAVAGHAFVANEDVNLLTKMQAVRYYVAFKAYKAAEAVFGAVTCCSGCCAAYRRAYLLPVIDQWQHQRFFGARCTFGDDRSLTNTILQQGYACVFSPTAVVKTFVPETWRQFMRQQMRWKKSWTRESLRAGTFMWKGNPVMSVSFYLGVILPLLAPVVVVRALVWYPLASGNGPWFYLAGLALIALIYGMYYYLHTRDRKWIWGTCFAAFYSLVLIWQLPYAIFRLGDARWGTR